MKQEKNANTLLQISELVREYILPRQHFFIPPKRFRALDGVSLSLNYGESFGIVGESGCGKSTLARTVLALESPQSGEVCFQGKVLHNLKPKDCDVCVVECKWFFKIHTARWIPAIQ